MRAGALVRLVVLAGFAAGSVAFAASSYDPSQLPSVTGTVLAYSLSPAGDVDGLILEDNTEVHLPPHLGGQLVQIAKPGDRVTVHGLRALAIPMVQALSITNDATGQSVRDTGPSGPNAPGNDFRQLTLQGRIRTQLHGPRGDLNGVLLDDGTIVRMPPPEAERLADQLRPGQSIVVQGAGFSGPLGRVVVARAIGSGPDRLTPLAPAPPPHRPRPPP